VKTLLGVLGLLTLTVASATATPCPTSGNWATFVGLGSCTSPDGLYSYSNFDFTSASAISPSTIAVNLITTSGNEGFFFDPGFSVGSGTSDDVRLFYSVTGVGVSFSGLSLDFNGIFTGTGTSLTAETYCLGSAVDLNSTACGGSQVTQVTNPPTNLQSSIVFGAVTTLSVSDHIVANGGTNGTAGISSVNNSFNNFGVPEPATAVLFGGGLLAFGLLRRRLRR
jgi:hypothetical protein